MANIVDTPSCDEFQKGCNLYLENEKRNPMYKVANYWISTFWGKSSDMADGLGVLLLTWNQAFYRYGLFDFNSLERCITSNFSIIDSFRNRDIFSFFSNDETLIISLFNDFLTSLADNRGRKSPVAVAKALHLLCPNFFPIWDNKIAKAYGCNYTIDPAKKYVVFCSKMKNMAIALRKCKKQDNKSILKCIDEFNYSKYTLKAI